MSELLSESDLHSRGSYKAKYSSPLFKFTMTGKEFNFSNIIILILSILMIYKLTLITLPTISSISLHLITFMMMKPSKETYIIPLLASQYVQHYKDTMPLFLPMDKLAREKHIQWKDSNIIFMMKKEE